MSSTWLPFLLLAVTCALVKTNGVYKYVYPGTLYPPAQYTGGFFSPYVQYQVLMPSNPPGPDCDNAKKPESDSGSSEGSSSEGSSSESGEKEKEGGSEEGKSEESKSSEEEEKKDSAESSSESDSSESSSGSSEEAETNKVKTGSALFPPRTYSFPPSVQQPLVYPSYLSAYPLMQSYGYPYRASYQYFANPGTRVISNPLVSSKVISSPLVYPATSAKVLPAVSKSYSIIPGPQVNFYKNAASWNSPAFQYSYYKR